MVMMMMYRMVKKLHGEDYGYEDVDNDGSDDDEEGSDDADGCEDG